MGLIPRRSKIAVLELCGTIERGKGTQSLINTLDALKDNNKIKAVLINIDCAGGDAAASNAVYYAVTRLVKQKPLIAYVSGMAVSGGYMVIAPATKIVAIPGSFVGSIGVVTTTMHAGDLLDAVGVGFTTVKSAPLKDMGAFYREMTEEEKAIEQTFVSSFHDYFVSLIAKGRKMDEAKVRELATGRFFLSEKATDIGLVDKLGDLEDAIDLTLQQGKLSKRRIRWIVPKKGLIQRWLLGANAYPPEFLTAPPAYNLWRHPPVVRPPDHRLWL